MRHYSKFFSNLPKISQTRRFFSNLPKTNFDIALPSPALSSTQMPVSIAEYRVVRQQLPPELQSQLPTEEEIEMRLKMK